MFESFCETKNYLTQSYLFVLPSHQRWKADDKRQYPKTSYQELCLLLTHYARVAHGSGHSQVAVQGYGAEIEDRGSAHPDIHGQPYRTPDVAEDPDLKKETLVNKQEIIYLKGILLNHCHTIEKLVNEFGSRNFTIHIKIFIYLFGKQK